MKIEMPPFFESEGIFYFNLFSAILTYSAFGSIPT